MKLVLLGKPGSGKGSEAELLAKTLKVPQISMGDILRSIEREKTEIGRMVSAYIDKGELVPDELAMTIFKERISKPDCKKGLLLDGFPRYLEQANELDKLMKIDKAIYLDVPDDLIIKRLSNRRSCSNCGAVYNLITNPPKKEGVCDKCGKDLYIRNDDKPETIKNRLKIYNEQTKPVVNFYSNKGILIKIDGSKSIDEVHKNVLKALGKSA